MAIAGACHACRQPALVCGGVWAAGGDRVLGSGRAADVWSCAQSAGSVAFFGFARVVGASSKKEQSDGPLAQGSSRPQAQVALHQSRQTRCHRMISPETKDLLPPVFVGLRFCEVKSSPFP